jgi:hypothetical protein
MENIIWLQMKNINRNEKFANFKQKTICFDGEKETLLSIKMF